MVTVGRLVVVVSALVVAGLALGLTLLGSPVLGVGADVPGQPVRSVLPGGPAWRNGIRTGQLVTALDLDGDLGWTLTTTSGALTYTANIAHNRSDLADAVPIAALAGTLVLAGLAMLRWRARVALALASGGVVIGAEAALVAGNPGLTTLSVVLAAATVAGALLLSGDGRPRAFAAAAVFSVGPAWAVARFALPSSFDVIDLVRRVLLMTVSGSLFVTALAPGPRSWAVRRPSLNLVDVIAATAFAVAALLAWRVLDVPPVVLGVAVTVALAGYAVARGVAARIVDRALIADVRERSRILAIEEERGRLARELHDEPLQRLAGVIKELERKGSSPGEASALMGIADELRALATDLRPPVLDDLGLVPALTSLALDGPVRVELALDDATGYDRASRLPADVELACYRVAAEAVRNALTHSGGSLVRITGSVASDRTALQIADDGRGLDPAAVRLRQRSGHLGLATMRQRATLVGATFAVDSGPDGTRVRIDWQRR